MFEGTNVLEDNVEYGDDEDKDEDDSIGDDDGTSQWAKQLWKGYRYLG